MITQHDTIALYRTAFGSVPYVLPRKGSTDKPAPGSPYSVNAKPSKTTVGEYGSAFYGVDAVGREYFCPVSLDQMALDYPVVRMEGLVDIVSTPMVERKGSVHEIISVQDYSIIIRGLIINHNGNEFDDVQVRKYFDKFEAGQSIVLRSVITDRALQPDYKAIIKRISVPEFFGVQNVFKYELELVSDFIFELEIL